MRSPQRPDDRAPAQFAPAATGRLTLRGVLRLLYRRKWFLLLPIAVALAGTEAVLTQLTPEYNATAVVIVEPGPTRLDVAPIAPGGPPEPSSRVVSDADLMQSPGVLGQTVDKLGLADDPDFGAAPPTLVARWWKLGRDWVRAKVGDIPGLPEDAVASPRARAIGMLADQVSAVARPPSTLIAINVRSADRAKAERIANVIADIYLAEKVRTRSEAARRTVDFFDAKLAPLKADYEGAEKALADFRARTGITGDGRTTVAQTLSELSTQLNQARLQTAERESRLKALQRAQSTPSARAGLTEIISNPVITGLQLQEAEVARRVTDLTQRYGDNYPRVPEAKTELGQVQARIASEIAKIAVSMQGDLDAARAKEAQLKEQVDRLEQQASDQGQAADEVRRLQARVDSTKTAYREMLKRAEELQERLATGQAEVRILSAAATSAVPVYPRYARSLYIAALAGLLFGLAWIGIVERLDNGIRSTEDVERLLGAPLVGMIPRLRAADLKASPIQLVLKKPMAVYAESLRLAHTAVTVATPSRAPRVVMVTSSIPGEGKSTFACSLAALVARSNPAKRVLLIDCDLRRSAVAQILGAPKDAGTLDQYLEKGRPLGEVLSRHAGSGLFYIAAKSDTANSAELLGSSAMAQLIEAFRDKFDLIILDTPPVMAVSDPRIVAQLVDFAVFVVRWEKTARDIAATAFKLLAEVAPHAGVVLSQVNLKRHAKYGYSDYAASYSKYSKYYVKRK